MSNTLNKLFGKEPISIECPVCKHHFKVKLSEIINDKSIVQCPACKTDIELEHDQITKKTLKDSENAAKNFAKSLDDLEKTFKNLGK